MTAQPTHRHDEFHRGVVPEAQVASGTPTAGYVPTASGTGEAAWSAAGIPVTIIDAKGDLIAGTAADTVARLAVGTNGYVLTADSGETTGLRWGAAASGATQELVYRYTVTGSDKASIDTGADTADAGSNDWTNGDVLEVWVIARTDEAAVTRSTATLVFNNDTGSNYDIEQFGALGTSVAGAGAVAGASLQIEVPGAGASANYASTGRATIPGFSGTTFYKTMEILTGYNHATAGSNFGSLYVGSWRSTSAITRVKLGCLSTNKLVVGSELLIYKRLAS